MSNERTIKITIYVLIALLLGFGIFVYANSKANWIRGNNPSSYEYSNGETRFLITNIKEQNYVGSQIRFYLPKSDQPYLLDLRYGPLQLEDVEIDRTIKQRLLDDKQIFITIDPKAGLTGKTTIAALEITKVLNNEYFFHIPVNASMISQYHGYAVKTCEDANQFETVMWFRLGEENSVKADRNCVILTGKTEEDLIREADRLALYLLGIMK